LRMEVVTSVAGQPPDTPTKGNLSIEDLLSLDRLCWLSKAGADVAECMDLALDKAIIATQSCCGAFILENPTTGRLETLATIGIPRRSIGKKQLESARSLIQRLQEAGPLPAGSDSEIPLLSPFTAVGAKVCLTVPVRLDGASQGLMAVAARRKRYLRTHVEVAERIAYHAALAVGRARACKEAEAKASFLEAACEISAALANERGLDDTLALVVSRAARVVEAESCGVGLMEEEDGRWTLRHAHAVGALAATMEGMKFDPSSWPLSAVIDSGKAAIFQDASRNPRIRPTAVRSWGVTSGMLAPLKLKDSVIGILAAGNRRDGRRFSSSDLRQFEAIANYAAVAIANSHLYTRTQEALAKLEAERTKLEGILTNLGDGVVVCDSDNRIVLVNRAAEDIMDVQAEAVLGKSLVALYPAEHREMLSHMLEHVRDPLLAEMPLHETKITLGHKVVRVNLSPVTSGGVHTGTAMVIQDVTSEEETGRAKTEFISTVAHELKTPLTSLNGAIRLLMHRPGEMDPQARELMDIAGNNIHRLVRLVEDMMDIARIEAGRMSLRLEPVSLYECAVDAVKEMQHVAADKSVSLMVRLVGAPPKAQADPDRIEQVMTNLLSNAIRFSPPNGEVIVSVRHIHGHVRVSVQDFGAGVPRKDLKRVFDKFYQVGGPASRKDGGTGLGLAISKAIVEQHGGKIYARSAAGHGSAFVFTVPIPSANSKAGEVKHEQR